MRTLWVLILFGSLIIHHCFTTTSGEAVPTTKEAQPSYSDCKPYVDAALKGDIPTEAPPPADPADLNEVADETSDSDEDAHKSTADEHHDDSSSEEDEPHKAPAQSSEEDDTEEPEINGLEVDEDEEDEKAAVADQASSEEDVAPPQPPPTPPKVKQQPPPVQQKPKAEEEPSEEDDSESDEGDGGQGAESNPAPATAQPNRAAHHSVAKDAHESAPPRSAPSPPPPETNKHKKNSNPAKETKAEVKAEPVPEPESEESVEEIIVKKTEKPKEKPKKVADEDDDDSAEDVKNPPKSETESKKPALKSKKVEDDDDSEEEHTKPKKSGKSKKVESEEDDDDDASPEEIKTKHKKSQKKPAKESAEEDDDDSDEQVKAKKTEKTKSKEKEGKVKVKTPAKKDESDEDDDDDDIVHVQKDYEPRSRDNLNRILGLDDTTDLKQKNNLLDKVTQQTLKELKSIYEYAIKPLETLYKYRDLSNRHFGDPEIFSKPMVVFMGPWSGGKSTIINWLLGIQDDEHALRTGADPSPAQFNILIHGNEEEVLDGTQLAADWTFSGLQKFGQSFLDRLRGRKLPNRLLEKVNLVEIPGILEIRKQVERSFPFNDACQWFIDRADVLFLVYDPAKLDIGPETEAILDQLKGRESQVRIVLNKADTVKPDELLRVQATLIWNISPLMASAEPPVLYVASLWDHPLQPEAPASLLNAHETLFLKDISDATLKRVETRIAAARRFAVRVRNHAKMCDCYLNTYNNHRSFFSNKKRISDDIIEHPQNYHIYEGLSTLTNISRYDLPDPDSYRDFFRLNPVWEFPTLASTCTYFRGCPINKLDIAIAYDLPELLGRYRRQRESIVSAPTGTLPDIKLKDAPVKKDAPIDIPKGKSRWYKLPPEEGHGQHTEDTKDKHAPPKVAAPPPPPPAPPKKEVPKGKNKWWKEVPEAVAKPEVKVKEEPVKKQKKEEAPPPEKLAPKEGFKIVEPTNKWYKPYYESIKPKDQSATQQEKPKGKNKWYKT